jgi:hypothetical protein
MEAAVPAELEFSLAPERLDEGTPEERAAYGLLSIRTAHQSLTEGFDHFINAFRPGPLVSGYHLAEWLAWNWWRLRWEPRSAAHDWHTAHNLTAIGEGYVWPDLDIWSDGVRSMLVARPSSQPDAKPFRYVGAYPLVVPSSLFETALDDFLRRILGRLRHEGVGDTNLDRLWRDLVAERGDPEIARRRRLGALMGREPEAVEDDAVEQLLAGSERLGLGAVEEVAAEQMGDTARREAFTVEALETTARTVGFAAFPQDSVSLDPRSGLPRAADVPAWRLGAEAARLLRLEERLQDAPIDDRQLAAMAGTRVSALTSSGPRDALLSFSLDDENGHRSRIVLPGKRKANRRFALARLIGDRLLNRAGALHPATHASTYRQKAQRSFAAELLAPFEAVEALMQGDLSEEAQLDAADVFSVPPLVINTLLRKHGRLQRDFAE